MSGHATTLSSTLVAFVLKLRVKQLNILRTLILSHSALLTFFQAMVIITSADFGLRICTC